jgi:protein O-mannosyl-transferase
VTSPVPHNDAPTSRSEWTNTPLLWFLTLVAHMPAMAAGWIWDDDSYITHDRFGRGLTELWHIWFDPTSVPQYYPVTHTFIWLQYQIYGPSPLGYHCFNILLHIIATTLLFRLLLKLDLPRSTAWLAAAIFGVHPVHVESVAWVTEIKNVLSLSFYLAAALAYFRFAPPQQQPQISDTPGQSQTPAPSTNKLAYFLSLLLFALAVLSKSVTSSLPAAILLVIYWKRGRVTLRDALPLLPMILFGGIMGRLTAHLEVHHVGAQGADWDFTFAQRLLIAGHAVWFYAASLLYPHNLAAMYDRWQIDTSDFLQWLYPITAALLVFTLIVLRNRIGRGPLVAALFFGGTLLPALGFFDVYPMRFSFVADHFQYHASLGVIVLVAASLVALARRFPKLPRAVPITLAALLLGVLAQQTWSRSWLFENDRVLWADTIARYPRVTFGRYVLANYLNAEGKHDEALAHLRAAVEAEPRMGHTHAALAQHYAAQGQTDLAIASYRDAIALMREPEPELGSTALRLAHLLDAQGKHDEALRTFDLASRSTPFPKDALENAGRLLLAKGDAAAALVRFDAAVAASPDDATAHYNRGVALQALRQGPAALDAYSAALKLNAAHSRAANNAAALIAGSGGSGQLQQAIELLQRTALLVPRDAAMRANLALMLFRSGRRDEALAQLAEARAIAPDSPIVARVAAAMGVAPSPTTLPATQPSSTIQP